MPSRCDIEAATPKCPVVDHPPRVYRAPGRIVAPKPVPCATPMLWAAGHWRCPRHGRQEFGEAA